MPVDWLLNGDNAALALLVLLPIASGAAWVVTVRRWQPATPAARWSQLMLGNFLGLVFLVSLLPLGGEVYYRFWHDTTDSLLYTKVSHHWKDRHWHTNALGFRDNVPYSFPLQPGRRRVTFIGDSFTAAHGVKDVERRFGNLIRRSHKNWEVHVLAQLGFDTGDEIRCLERVFAKGYQVDEVVLVYCLNDVADLMPEWQEATYRIFTEAQKSGWWRHNSFCINLLAHRFKASRDPYVAHYFEFVAAGYREPTWTVQQTRLKALRDLVEAHGGKISVVTFPFLHAIGPRYQFAVAHAQLDRFWRELNVPHLDLLPTFEGLSPGRITVNPFDAHPNEFAHDLAAKEIDKFLISLMQ